MQYRTACVTDVGTTKTSNQDSVIINIASYSGGTVCLASVCDGMGGLAKGELASSTAVGAQDDWFRARLPLHVGQNDLTAITNDFQALVTELNEKIGEYGRQHRVNLGTTLTTLICIEDVYGIIHVGDCAVYVAVNGVVKQLTKDQTLVQREADKGMLTPQEAKVDPRRNVLLQCVGASKIVVPEVISGQASLGDIFLICSDGFRHVLTDDELTEAMLDATSADEDQMQAQLRTLVDLCKSRGETDNISAVFVKLV